MAFLFKFKNLKQFFEKLSEIFYYSEMEPNTLKYFNIAERLKSFENKWNFDKQAGAKCTSKEAGLNSKNSYFLVGCRWLCLYGTGFGKLLYLSTRNGMGAAG